MFERGRDLTSRFVKGEVSRREMLKGASRLGWASQRPASC